MESPFDIQCRGTGIAQVALGRADKKASPYSLNAFGMRKPAALTSGSRRRARRRAAFGPRAPGLGQPGRDAPRLSVLRQRFDRGLDPVLVSARDHDGAVPGDHLVGRGRAHVAAAADDHDLAALEALTHDSCSLLTESRFV